MENVEPTVPGWTKWRNERVELIAGSRDRINNVICISVLFRWYNHVIWRDGLTRDCSILLPVVIFICLLGLPSCSIETGCWRKKNPFNVRFYSFCYNMGTMFSLLSNTFVQNKNNAKSFMFKYAKKIDVPVRQHAFRLRSPWDVAGKRGKTH